MPIPKASKAQRSDLINLAGQCQAKAGKRYALQSALTRRIPDLAPSATKIKMSNKLKEWWLLPDFAAFRAEVKKSLKAEIALAERSAWEDWITRDKAEIARLAADIKSDERRIDAIVYDLFHLTAAEIELLEGNI